MRNVAFIATLSGSVILGALSLACGGSVADAASVQSAASTAPVGASTHGPVKVVGAALGTVALRPDQRTELEQLAAAAEARHETMRGARQDLMGAIAAQVEAGKIDRAMLQPKMDATAKAFEAVRPGDAAALERMHTILDTSQREKFVDALEAQFKSKRGEHNPRSAMQAWATELKLTDAQRDQIKALLKAEFHKGSDGHHGDHGDHAKGGHGGKVLEAFKSDHFVASEVMPDGAKAQQASARFLGMAEAIVPLLTPEQRTIAATKLRAEGFLTGE